MPWSYRASLWLAAHTIPGARFTGRGLGKQASDNIGMLRALAGDPLFIKETRVGAVWGLVNLMDAGLTDVAALPGPALYLYGAHDEIIPPAATGAALDRLAAAGRDDVRFALYGEGWHMLLRDLQRATVQDDIAAWMLDGADPLPSGAEADARARFAKLAAN
jgi:alpha-beta hydrolase superfamily lysophospholipase